MKIELGENSANREEMRQFFSKVLDAIFWINFVPFQLSFNFFPKSKCDGKCNPTYKKNVSPNSALINLKT